MLEHKVKKSSCYLKVTLYVISPDFDECIAVHNCHDNATCKNIDGGFTCTCNAGYNGDGVSCNGRYSLFLNLKKSLFRVYLFFTII